MRLAAVVAAVSLAFVAGRMDRPQDEKKQDAKKQDEPKKTSPYPDPMEAMKRWKATMAPSEAHQYLHQFVGKWTTTMKLSMGGPGAPPMTSEGTAEYRWLVPSKWLIREADGAMPMMGKVKSFAITGYDNYKKKYVSVQVDSMTTAMLYGEGMLDQSGKNRFLYGPMDEPMTGEHDKPVKYATRVISEDEHVEEVHDLAIGETNTKVIEVVYKRVK